MPVPRASAGDGSVAWDTLASGWMLSDRAPLLFVQVSQIRPDANNLGQDRPDLAPR
jgi:hypothetical protein